MYKIGMIGPKTYNRPKVVKDFLFKVKSTFGTTATIMGGGSEEGFEKFVKKYSLELGLKYFEFNPSYTGHNLYSFLPEHYYGKPFHISHFSHRYDLLLKNVDRLVIGRQEDDKGWKTFERYSKLSEKKGLKFMFI